ncbi:MAG TPA: cyclic pyranopterin monophosphate synthase MoaC [Gemmatimonadaceae bacterium]|nr:cyclic pyranopterin monophosphate synthase MoaC [Gemmatimonadaceae bacterium]
MKKLSHVDGSGQARMVDVGAKPVSERIARATGSIRMKPDTLKAIQQNALVKGDVLGVARIAGIMAAKRTAELIPLCHPISLTDVQVALELDESLPGVTCEATTKTTDRTGVEMEAITAVVVSLTTVYDMVKSVDRGVTIGDIRLLEKDGGRSGHWVSP